MRHYLLFVLVALFLFGACDDATSDPFELEEWGSISISGGYPLTLLPASRLTIEGGPFPDASFGVITVNIDGVFQSEGSTYNVTESRLATWIDGSHISISIPPDLYERLAGGAMRSGSLSARFWVEAISSRTQKAYVSSEVPVNITLSTALTPSLDSVTSGSVTHFESPITFSGSDLLMGTDEGETLVVLNGCFLPYSAAGTCETDGTQISAMEIPLIDFDERLRSGGSFGIPVSRFGVDPGYFEGTLLLRNLHQGGTAVDSAAIPFAVDLIETEITSILTTETSMGGYIDIAGEGFAAQGSTCGTTLFFEGLFEHASGGSDPLSMVLIPQVESSSKLRYIVEENVDIGEVIDLRKADGVLSGEITPEVCCASQCQQGLPMPISVGIGPVKQVVKLSFQDSYRAALARFGLAGAELKLQQRMIDVINEIYQGINLEVRSEPVLDYALYSIVEIHGFDPNNLGLMGYDNTVGKDVGNLRLYDIIGGVNSHTQEDGYPGYGGVFLESYLGFSRHPPEGISSIDLATELFDEIFDPLRPDRGGVAVTSADLATIVAIDDPAVCLTQPSQRSLQISCAVYVLGNIVGGTIAHELGHSMGLAEPGSMEIFHNLGDQSFRLMDSGGMRPFDERAGLSGTGIEVFCISNYQYLRSIMPDPAHNDPGTERPGC